MTCASVENAPDKRAKRAVRILVIEDSEPDVFLVREALAQCDMQVELHVVDDGELGVEFIENVERGEAPQPDLIVLDLNLPRRSGVQVLERIRGSSTCERTPVVIFTSSDSPKDKEHTALLGATFFRKPSRLNEFMMLGPLVQRLLSERASA